MPCENSECRDDVGFQPPPDSLPDVYLLMRWESGRQCCHKMDWLSGDGVLEFQKLGVQKISSIAGKARQLFKRLAV